ncbi:MAG: DUF1778 domain-containing protein [Chlorobiaceae bacterium]
MAAQETKNAKLDIRLTFTEKDTLSRAAKGCTHSTLTHFVLQSAMSRAEELLADRRLFGLDAQQWAAFHAALDAPCHELPGVKKLFQEKSIFEVE